MSDKDKIRNAILTLELGYEYQMSDYATSREQELEYKRIGLEKVDTVVDTIMEIYNDAIDDAIEDNNWHRNIGDL